MSKEVCSYVKKCGVQILAASKENKEPSSTCNHALPHEHDQTCGNHICLRIAPTPAVCEPVAV